MQTTKEKIIKFKQTVHRLSHQQKITEKFHRNPDVDANEDVETRMFVVADDKITVSFHRNDENITNSTRTYYKPPNAEEKGGNLPWNKDMTTAYMVGFL